MPEKKTVIEIWQVANGYVVMPVNLNERGLSVQDDNRLVFQTFTELVDWMFEQYLH